MFDHKHYVPILKAKKGEYGALLTLSPTTKSRLTPLLEVPPIPWDFQRDTPARSLDAHLKNVALSVQKHWGTDRPVFLDLSWTHPPQRTRDGRHPLTYVLDDARARGVQLIPTTSLNRDASYQAAVNGALLQDHRGVCIRLDNEDFEDVPHLHLPQFLDSLSLSPPQVDLLLDLRELSQTQTPTTLIAVRSIINTLPDIQDWRTLTLAASAFPQNLTGFGSDSINRHPRIEWTIWAALFRDKAKIQRLPTFGDYAIAHPELIEVDPVLMRMSANLRYTAINDWIILKGRNVRDYGYGQFNNLCAQLVGLRDYSGSNFSWGDRYISRCSREIEGPGNATTWRKVGTSHHLTFITEQLSTTPGL